MEGLLQPSHAGVGQADGRGASSWCEVAAWLGIQDCQHGVQDQEGDPSEWRPSWRAEPAKKITLVWRKELLKKYSSCVKLLTKYETTIAELQPKVDKLKTLKKKLEDKAHGKGVSLETDVAKKSAASEEGS